MKKLSFAASFNIIFAVCVIVTLTLLLTAKQNLVGKIYYDPTVKYGVESPDAIYVINLERNQDRLKQITARLNKENLKFIRFNAINGYDVEITNINKNLIFTGNDLKANSQLLRDDSQYIINCGNKVSFISTPRIKFNHKKFSAGEFGCSCSHISIWHDIIKHNYKSALILEDDAILVPDFKQKFATLLANTPQDYDLLFLILSINPYIANNPLSLNSYNQHTYKITTNPNSGMAISYILTHDGARKLLEQSKKLDNTIDSHMSEHFSKLNTYLPQEYLVINVDNNPSEINEMGRKHKLFL